MGWLEILFRDQYTFASDFTLQIDGAQQRSLCFFPSGCSEKSVS